MNAFFPNKDIDQAPFPPSKAERISSWIIGVALVPAVSLQMIGAVPLHALRDAGLGAIGSAADSTCALFHGLVSTAAPQAASWPDALPVAASRGIYLGALTLFAGAVAVSVTLGMRRERKNFVRRIGDARSW
ncbi:hypothetical protein SB768_25270 [Burkholderia sp. SIMBA_043]|uniref:hypothetical protein n=1 Tax=Burkholderia TaxID=32008 RepID=UPI0005D9ED87|nr:hypothetical protein [Burkholderia vietnamiensis]AJY03051.1 putative membrane-bound serine protease [Burkholderia vietnamiensis LMG 10929]AVR13900.1 hypothetical protein A8H33_10025 [Burkholderia vietnamiensis]KVM51610.1 hypothetical protein WJ57_15740 [Burkholderia vietnamiensis]KVS03758.1 hypothetical protein WK30_10280 [Burkholderia vietnamiensis]UBI29243.1 hypothetical protein LA325_31085 [Burkholderia vietnamiensis]